MLTVMHLAADRKSAYMISIHDIHVPIPCHGRNKINAALHLVDRGPR